MTPTSLSWIRLSNIHNAAAIISTRHPRPSDTRVTRASKDRNGGYRFQRSCLTRPLTRPGEQPGVQPGVSVWAGGWVHQLLNSHLSDRRGHRASGESWWEAMQLQRGWGKSGISLLSPPLHLPKLNDLEASGQEVEAGKRRINTNGFFCFSSIPPPPSGDGCANSGSEARRTLRPLCPCNSPVSTCRQALA